MYLKRKIDDYLIKWKQNDERLPLIIKGARQIGKTESINNFPRFGVLVEILRRIVLITSVLPGFLDKMSVYRFFESCMES